MIQGVLIGSKKQFEEVIKNLLERKSVKEFLLGAGICPKSAECLWQNTDGYDYDCLEIDEWDFLHCVLSADEYKKLAEEKDFIEIFSYRIPVIEKDMVFYFIGSTDSREEFLCYLCCFLCKDNSEEERYYACCFMNGEREELCTI